MTQPQFYEFSTPQKGAEAYALFMKDNSYYNNVLKQTTASGQLQTLASSKYALGGYNGSTLEQIYQDIQSGSIPVGKSVQAQAQYASSLTGLDPRVIETQWQAENGANGALASTADWSSVHNNVGNIEYSTMPSMGGVDQIASKTIHQGATYYNLFTPGQAGNAPGGSSYKIVNAGNNPPANNVNPYTGLAGFCAGLDLKLNQSGAVGYIGIPYSGLWRFFIMSIGFLFILVTLLTNKTTQTAIVGAMLA